MSTCEHMKFEASVDVGRLTDQDGVVTSYTAAVRIICADCGRDFQFLGLPPGIDLQGARVSIDALEANLAICPQGEQPSPLSRLAINFAPDMTKRH